MRYLNLGTVTAERSQAVYHAVAQAMSSSGEVTLITVSPARPYVCAGYHQVTSREIDVDYCAQHDIPIGRRMTGGGAVYLDHNQIFWHLILPQNLVHVDKLYEQFLPAPIRVYQRLGIPAEHRPVNDIVVGLRKIGGTGAASIGEATVLVGSVMLDFDVMAMSRVLRVPSEKFRDKLVSSLTEYMTSIRREYGERFLPGRTSLPDRTSVTQMLVEEFGHILGEPIHKDTLTQAEAKRVAQMEVELFDAQFVFRSEGILHTGVKISSSVQLYEGVHKAPGGLIRLIYRERDNRFDDVLLAGDFFAYPETSLETFAHNLLGQQVSLENVTSEARGLLASVNLPGVTVEDVISAFQAAKTLPTVQVG